MQKTFIHFRKKKQSIYTINIQLQFAKTTADSVLKHIKAVKKITDEAIDNLRNSNITKVVVEPSYLDSK